MAKSIDLKAGKPGPMSSPPPASPPVEVRPEIKLPGLKGQAPLPIGKVTAVPNPHLKPAELEKLKSLGYQEGDPLPADIASLVAQLEADALADVAADHSPDVDPATPPLDPQTVDIESLTPAKQAEFRDKVKEMIAKQPVPAPASAKPLPEVAKKVAAARNVDEPAPAIEEEPASTGATAHTHCQHCGWDQRMDDIPEPPYKEKVAFQQTLLLGDKPYSKDYHLMGDKLMLRFRTLTLPEIDAIYAQVTRERKRGDISTDMDSLEKINRYRLFLQLQVVSAGTRLIELPEGLDTETNPNAASHWQGEGELLPQVANYVNTQVLTSESLMRMAQRTCQMFNRLVSRLEAMADNSDFWRETEVQR
jgi:hypothetical protein